jgi:hypothetical protein
MNCRVIKKLLFGFALVVVGCLGSSPAFAAKTFSFTYFDPALETQAFGINNSGEVVGSYIDSIGYHGFTANTAGAITSTFDYPGSTFIQAESINNKGQISGYYELNGLGYGFIYDRSNSSNPWFSYRVPVATTGKTVIDYINDNGDFNGRYYNDVDGKYHGYLVPKGGTFSEFNILDPMGNIFWTEFDTYTNAGHKAGHFMDGSKTIGFVFLNDADKTEFRIEIPGYLETELERMNNLLECVGYAHTTGTAPDGSLVNIVDAFYLDNPDGSASFLFTPGLWPNTYGEGINDNGVIVGYVFDGQKFRGYVATPSNTVPEPSTFLLTGAGIAALGFLARRRSRNSR